MNDTPTPRTDDSETRARKNGFSPLIEYCYANDMAKLETELTTVTEQRDRLAEALRKAVSWGDSASHHILHRQNINWTYLNEAKEALQSLNQNANCPSVDATGKANV